MIHYHGTPLTPNKAMLDSLAHRHAMISYERPDQLEMAAEVCQSIVLDNGAFSAWKQKKSYDFDGYIKWVNDWRRHPCVDWWVIPDVIDGSEEINDAWVARFSNIPNGVPVWHMHESMERLERLMHVFQRIALGSSGQFARIGNEAWWRRIGKAMDTICDEDGVPQVKLHGLRMLDPVVFSHLPFASADSCNVARNIGIDSAWKGTYIPKSKGVRAEIMMSRIEAHASAAKWNRVSRGVQENFELMG